MAKKKKEVADVKKSAIKVKKEVADVVDAVSEVVEAVAEVVVETVDEAAVSAMVWWKSVGINLLRSGKSDTRILQAASKNARVKYDARQYDRSKSLIENVEEIHKRKQK